MFTLGSSLDIGSQMLLEGRAFSEIHWGRVAISGATAVIGGAMEYASSALIRQAGLTGGRALTASATGLAVDFGAGVAADHYLLGDNFGTAVFSNALGFGIGEGAEGGTGICVPPTLSVLGEIMPSA